MQLLANISQHPELFRWYQIAEISNLKLKDQLYIINTKNPAWCRWLFTRLMTREQCIEIAVFSAEQVLGEYERRHPNNDRPRRAIDAAKAVIKNDTEENRRAAHAAYTAANAAYYAANAASAAYAASAAANAAYYAANAAAYNAAYAAASAADAAVNTAAMRTRIIEEAVRILERNDTIKFKLDLPNWW